MVQLKSSIKPKSSIYLSGVFMLIKRKSLMLKKIVVLCALISVSANSTVGAGHVVGKITNITSGTNGLLVRIGANEVPLNCTSGNKWLEIKQENTAMTALTITAWTLGRKVSVYTSPATSGYCRVTQLDPSES